LSVLSTCVSDRLVFRMAVEDELKVVKAMKAPPKGAKRKAKGKAKVKAKATRTLQESGPEGAPAPKAPREPKAPKENFKAKILKELETRDVLEVLEGARGRIAAAEKAVAAIDGQDRKSEAEGALLKEAVQNSSQNVDTVVEKESQAFEKLKKAKSDNEELDKDANSIKAEKTENDKFMAMLQVEWKNKANSIEAGRAKKHAQEAATAAKTALAEQRLLEREALANQKKVLQEQRDREKAMMSSAAGASPGAKARSKHSAQAAKKVMAHELADFDKMRAARMKMRAQVAGKAKGRGKGGKVKSPGTPKRKIADVD